MLPSEIFRENVRPYFPSKGGHRKKLADALGVDIKQVSAYFNEKNPRNFSEHRLVKIADFLGMRYVDLIQPDSQECPVLQRFISKKRARRYLDILLEIERLDPYRFVEIESRLNAELELAKRGTEEPRKVGEGGTK